MPVKHWHEALGDATVADAILDRLVHNAHRIELRGHESLRGLRTAVTSAPSALGRAKTHRIMPLLRLPLQTEATGSP